jgi:hypothetical protein
MTNVNMISAFIGALLSITIVFLTRRDHISPLVAARWFLISILVLVVSFFPSSVDKLGAFLGIGYPPVIPILIALGAAMIKILMMDIERQKMQVKLDRVIQRLAIIEQSVESSAVVKANFSKKVKHN